MLEKILGSSGKVSLLRALLTSGEEEFSLNELARRSGLSPSTALRELGELAELVEYDPFRKRYRAKETPLSKPLRELFDLERMKVGKSSLLTLLPQLGFYYLSGTPSLLLRGMGRDFTASPQRLMILCDRRISKVRGALLSLFPSYQLLLLEERMDPRDYLGGEVCFQGRMVEVNLAVTEKAVVDSLWRWRWEGENLVQALYCLLEQPLDLDLLKGYARRKGRKVEARLRRVLEVAGRAGGARFSPEGLRPEKVERKFEELVEEAVDRVLRG
ncbi:MAG: helix-turn-helix domain-containing protein [Candidatus Hadarchaeales archaeon]